VQQIQTASAELGFLTVDFLAWKQTGSYLNRVRFESGSSRWVGWAARIPI